MKGKILMACLVLLVAAMAWLLWLVFVDDSVEVAAEADASPKAQAIAVKPAETNAVAAKRGKKPARDGAKNDGKTGKKRRIRLAEPYSPADQQLADAVQAALDNDSYDDMLKAAAAAMESKDPNLRGEAVDGLGWFGEKAMVPLTKAMMDKNSEVADNARGQVEQALMGMDDSRAAFDFAASYINTFGGDKEAISMFEGVLTSSASQFTDPEDVTLKESVQKARDDRQKIVETLMAMMNQGGDLEKSAKSAYEEITGEQWTNTEDAENWINEPEMPEDDEESNDE